MGERSQDREGRWGWIPPEADPLVFALIIHGLLAYIGRWPVPRRPFGDERTYLAAAEALRAGEPYPLDMLWPPLYPHLLAWIPNPLAVTALQVLALAAAVFLLGDIVRRLLPTSDSAPVSILWLAAYPPLAAFAYYRWPEIPHLLWFTGMLWILITGRRRWPWMVLLAVLMALALATKSLLGPFLPVLLWPLVREPKGLPRAAGVASLAFVLLLPTMLANAQQEGRFAVASSGAFNLWVGLNEGMAATAPEQEDAAASDQELSIVVREVRAYRASAETVAERDRILWGKIRAFVREHGVGTILWAQLSTQYQRLFEARFFLTDQLPGGPIAQRGVGYPAAPEWIVKGLRDGSHAMYIVLLAGAVLGLMWLVSGRVETTAESRRWWWVLGLFLVYNLALFLVLHVKTRYRIQMLPVLALFAVRGWDTDGIDWGEYWWLRWLVKLVALVVVVFFVV